MIIEGLLRTILCFESGRHRTHRFLYDLQYKYDMVEQVLHTSSPIHTQLPAAVGSPSGNPVTEPFEGVVARASLFVKTSVEIMYCTL